MTLFRNGNQKVTIESWFNEEGAFEMLIGSLLFRILKWLELMKSKTFNSESEE